MSILRIVGIVVCALSGMAIWSTMSKIGRANQRMKALGSNETMPFTTGLRVFVLGIHAAFLVGLALIFLGS